MWLNIGVSLILALAPLPGQSSPLECRPPLGRDAEEIHGEVNGGRGFAASTPSGWLLRLTPVKSGWFLSISVKGRETEDLARLTPPWHFVPNPREIEGWHLRNRDNTGPNDGSVNAPRELREFIFSPEVGRSIEYHGSGTRAEDVERVRAFGRGWLHLSSYRLTPPRRGERAAFEWLQFSACLNWPSEPVNNHIRTPPSIEK